MSTYVVGDIHGCLDELQSLLSHMDFSPKHDTLISVGDLINRGPKSLETLEFLANLPSFQCVLGNHDLYLLALWQGVHYPNHGMDAILDHPSCDKILAWLLQHPLIIQHQQWTIVHAGIPPLWTLSETLLHAKHTERAYQQNPKRFFHSMIGDTPSFWESSLNPADQERFTVNALTRMRLVSQEGGLHFETPSSQEPNQCIPWFTHQNHCFTQKNPIIFGHWAALNGKTQNPYVIGLDTGCVWGNALSAIRLEDQQRFQVASQQPLRPL